MSKPPYGFVPVDVAKTRTAAPIFHHGANAEQDQLLSGELHCTLTTLTPLLVGNEQYTAAHVAGATPTADGKVQLPSGWKYPFSVDKDKPILEPLRDPQGRVLIPPRSIKGMIRQSIGALTNAPMERVAERHHLFRPNASRDFHQGVLNAFPAYVHSVSADEIIIAVGKAGDPIFVTTDASTNLKKSAGDLINVGVQMAGVSNSGRKLFASGSWKPTRPFRVCDYRGGTNGKGQTYSQLLVPTTSLHRFTIKKASGLWDHLRKSQEFERRRADRKGQGEMLDVDHWTVHQGIFVELNAANEIVSLGHHYRYLWPYSDSTTTTNGTPRAEVRPHPDERHAMQSGNDNEAHIPPERLTAARNLFGFVADGSERSSATTGLLTEIAKGDYMRLAGRIAPNFAVEETGDPGNEGRFLGNGQALCLRALSSPRTSAVEHYLDGQWTQDRTKTADGSPPLKTYGEPRFDSAGNVIGHRHRALTLSGRKFYRHAHALLDTDWSLIAWLEAGFDPIVLRSMCEYIATDPDTNVEQGLRRSAHRLSPFTLTSLLAAQNQLEEIVGFRLPRQDHPEFPRKRRVMTKLARATERIPIPGELKALHNNQATLVRFATAPETKFKFTVRFRDLRPAELALLRFALSPQSLADALENDPSYLVGNSKYAQKLGHARPLGWGSVSINIDHVRILGTDGRLTVIEDSDERTKGGRESCLQALKSSEKTTREWLDRMRLPQQPEPLDYPRDRTKGPIYQYHSRIRSEHGKARSKDKTHVDAGAATDSESGPENAASNSPANCRASQTIQQGGSPSKSAQPLSAAAISDAVSALNAKFGGRR